MERDSIYNVASYVTWNESEIEYETSIPVNVAPIKHRELSDRI